MSGVRRATCGRARRPAEGFFPALLFLAGAAFAFEGAGFSIEQEEAGSPRFQPTEIPCIPHAAPSLYRWIVAHLEVLE